MVHVATSAVAVTASPWEEIAVVQDVKLFKWGERNNLPLDRGFMLFQVDDAILHYPPQRLDRPRSPLLRIQDTKHQMDDFDVVPLIFPFLDLDQDGWAVEAVAGLNLFQHKTVLNLAAQLSSHIQASFRVSPAELQGSERLVFVVDVCRESYLHSSPDEWKRLRDSSLHIREISSRSAVLGALTGCVRSGDMNGDGSDHELADIVLGAVRRYKGPGFINPVAPSPHCFFQIEPKLKLQVHHVETEACDDGLTSIGCAICLNEFQEGETIVSTQCGHVFHRGCIFKWLAKQESCPLCRSSCIVHA